MGMPKAATMSNTPRKRIVGISLTPLTDDAVADHVGEMHRQRRAAAEADDVDVAITGRELRSMSRFASSDAIVSADAECTADDLARKTVLGADTLVEELGAGVQVLEPDHVGVQVVAAGILFGIPCPVECIQCHAGRLPTADRD